MWDQLDATISDFIVNQLFLNMFWASLRPSSGGQTAFSLHMVICPVVTVVMLESTVSAESCDVAKQPTPHSAHSLPADSPTSQQSQQDR